MIKYNNIYKEVIKEVKKLLPHVIDDNYINHREKYENGKKGGSYTVEYIWGLCGQDAREFDLSGLSIENFRELSFDTNTKFSKEQIDRFDPFRLLELGKKLGLGIELLHKAGIDGKGVSVAIIDRDFDITNSEMYDEEGNTKIRLYDVGSLTEQIKKNDDFHGKTVTSILCGTTVGVAPHSHLYFFADDARSNDQGLIQLLEKIRDLNENGANISIVSLSSLLQDKDINDEFTRTLAKQNCAFLSSNNFWQLGFDYMNRDSRKDINDPNNFYLENPADISQYTKEAYEENMISLRNTFSELENYVSSLYAKLDNPCSQEEKLEIEEELKLREELLARKEAILNTSYEQICQDMLSKCETQLKEKIFVPSGGRTYPQIGKGYKYCGHSSASWTIPQVAGLYVLARQLDPFLSFEEFTEISKETSYQNENGYCVINPIGIAIKVNELNQVKAQDDERYKNIFANSSCLISRLEELIEAQKEFGEKLRDHVHQTVISETKKDTSRDEQEPII